MLKSRLRSAKKKMEYDIYLYMHDASEENKTQMEKNLCNLIKKNQMFSFSQMPKIKTRSKNDFCEFQYVFDKPFKSNTCVLMCINKQRNTNDVITQDDIGAFMTFYFQDKIYEPKRINATRNSLDIISAVKENDLNKVKQFYRDGYSLDTKDSNYYTALMLAIHLNYLPIADFLITHGADLDIHIDGISALYLACKNERNYDILLKLIQYGANVTSSYPMHVVITANNQKAADLLLMKGSMHDDSFGDYEKEEAEDRYGRSLIFKYWDKKKYRLSDFEKQCVYVDILCRNQKYKNYKGAASILLDILIKCTDKTNKKNKSFFLHLRSMKEVEEFYYSKKFNYFYSGVAGYGTEMKYGGIPPPTKLYIYNTLKKKSKTSIKKNI